MRDMLTAAHEVEAADRVSGPVQVDPVFLAEVGLLPMYHHGKMVGGYPSHQAWIRDDEMVVPPEKYREARDYMTSAMGDSGGGSRTIVLTLDGKTVAKVVDGHTRAMRRTKEVAA